MSGEGSKPEFPPTPFFSPRNVPFWMGLLFVLAVAGMILWIP